MARWTTSTQDALALSKLAEQFPLVGIVLVTLKNGTKRTYPWQDILHVPSLGGLAPIKQAREAIGLCMAMEKHAGRLFGNGARPGGVLKVKGKLTDPVYERLKKSWGSGHSGENSGRTAILEDGADFQALTFNSVDLQFQELRGFQVIEIALERLAHGSSVEEIVEQHRGLISLAQVHAALAYYYDHEADLNAEIERQLETADRLRSASLSSPGRFKLKQMGRL